MALFQHSLTFFFFFLPEGILFTMPKPHPHSHPDNPWFVYSFHVTQPIMSQILSFWGTRWIPLCDIFWTRWQHWHVFSSLEYLEFYIHCSFFGKLEKVCFAYLHSFGCKVQYASMHKHPICIKSLTMRRNEPHKLLWATVWQKYLAQQALYRRLLNKMSSDRVLEGTMVENGKMRPFVLKG